MHLSNFSKSPQQFLMKTATHLWQANKHAIYSFFNNTPS